MPLSLDKALNRRFRDALKAGRLLGVFAMFRPEKLISLVRRWRKLWLSIAFILFVSGTFAYWSLRESFAHGRLATEPNYDDVAYFLSGTQVLQSLRSGHVMQTLGSYMHSPYSVLLAASSFAICGAKDWAPYAGNVVVVICYLAALSYFVCHLPTGVQMGALLAFLSFPFATMAVVEFRPDIMWSVLVGFTAVYLSTANREFSSRVEGAALGFVYGAAMMTKPSTFLMTTAVIGLAGVLRTLRGAFSGKLTLLRFFGWLTCFFLAALLVAGPYYSLHFREIWSYFYKNSFGINKHIWVQAQTLSTHLGHYIDSQNASTSNLGRWRLPILFFVGLGLPLGILRTKDREKRAIFASLAVLVIATWLASSLFGMKSPFLGGAFYGTLIFACAYLLAEVVKPAQELLSRPIAQSLSFAGLAGVSFAMHTWPAYSEWDWTRARFYRRANIGVWKEIRSAASNYSPADGVIDVYCSNSSPIPAELPALRALQKRIPLRMHSGSLADSMNAQRLIFERCDMLVTQDPGLPEVNPNFPSEKIQAHITSELLSRPEFRLTRSILAVENKQIYVLHNKQSLLPKQ